ncbi:MAG: class I SAM-dependent methyltransferase [Chloracidobacterium sp.]|nr:class I SAM-dependent methyltransferase [Chloracidobacterium sp.]
MAWQDEYLARYYSAESGWVDGNVVFHGLCESVIAAGGEILEVGAGPTNITSDFLATLGRLHGVDIDADVRDNTALAAAHVLDGEAYPFEDNTFDACVSNYVIEHVADPTGHLAEIRRVLKPGGSYIFRTPNFWHYVSLVSHLTPHSFHTLVANRLRNLPAESHDPYPTHYRLNTRASIERAAKAAGLTVERLDLIEKEPMYGLGSRLLFFPFMAYERIVNSSEAFSGLRANILGVLKK